MVSESNLDASLRGSTREVADIGTWGRLSRGFGGDGGARRRHCRMARQDKLVWLLEHPPIKTARHQRQLTADLIDARFPVYHTGRGGQFTYRGPGQRIGYVMLNLKPAGAQMFAASFTISSNG